MKNMATYTTFYVSKKSGSDWNTGENPVSIGATDGPLATVDCAWQRIMEMRRFGAWQPITVRLLDEEYETDHPICLSPDPDVPVGKCGNVTFESYGNRRTVVSGGRRITGWGKDTFNGTDCLSVFLPEVKAGKWQFSDLYVNGTRAELPRFPEDGLLLPESVENNIEMFNEGSHWFVARKGDIRDFRNFDDCIISFCHWWIDEHVRIAKYDPATRKVTLAAKTRFSISDFKPHSGLKYYIENVAESFEKPGQWYLDRPTGMLYYLPRDGETADTLSVHAPVVDRILDVSGRYDKNAHTCADVISGIRFRNLDFAYSKGDYVSRGFAPNCETASDEEPYAADPQACSSMHGAVNFSYAKNCAVENCRFFCFGTHGLVLEAGTVGAIVRGNSFREGGGGGIRINGEGRVNAPDPRAYTWGNRITDNELSNLGRRHFAACGILSMFSYDNEISHNEIHDLYYSGISCGWDWGYQETVSHDNRIEKNHIYRIGDGLLSDMGGIYTLGKQPGTIVSGNVIHDVTSRFYGGWALYTDEGSSYMTIENNVCYNVSENCFHQHFGGQNVVRNNIFAFSRDGSVRLSKPETHMGVLMDGNLHYLGGSPKYGRNDEFGFAHSNLSTVREMIFDRQEKQPLLFRIGDPEHPEDDRTFTLEQMRVAYGVDEDTLIADPGFRDPDHFDFTLSPDSFAVGLGFVPIDTSDVGPRVRL